MKFSAIRSAIRAELGVTVHPVEGAHARPHIYLTINTATLGQPGMACFYVGKHVGRDARYLGSGKRLQAAIRKYGAGAFQRVLLTFALDYDDKASGEHCEYEQRYLDRWRVSDNARFYNLSDSSGGGGENGRRAAAAARASLTPERLREVGRKGGCKAAEALSSEKRTERARKAAMALTPEQRSAMGRKSALALNAARTPECEAYRLERVRVAVATKRAAALAQGGAR
ncbi:MAG: hypothetical protein AB1761_18185 [Pseudomonadota bacterium]